MIKDYFEDIASPAKTSTKAPNVVAQPTVSATKPVPQKPALSRSAPVTPDAPPTQSMANGAMDRSIRNIAPVRTRPRLTPPPVSPSQNMWNTGGMTQVVTRHSRWWLWFVALGALLVLGAVLIFSFRPTTVTVTSRSHTVVFSASNRYTAYPVVSAQTGALAYTLKTLEFEDSEAVSADGTEQVEEKAHGAIMIFNEYSAAPVRLIKNTRFQTPEGLVFRVPNTVTVPGKKGTVPGSISAEVYADEPGKNYNVGPVARLTLPGLKTSPDMYATVYAKSDVPFAGGFIGERPRVPAAALESVRAAVRARLEEKATGGPGSDGGGLVLPGLYNISFVSDPHTTEAGGGVRIHEKAIVTYPLFTLESFSRVVASGAVADAENATIRFTPGATFSATADSGLSKSNILEAGSFSFSLGGEGTIIFNVDTDALKNALAGREKSAFETIVASFSGIETARARVSPFWSSTFPSDPADITVVVEDALR